MTRAFQQLINCPYCGKEITAESAFSRWIRNHPELESDKGYTTTDHDLCWHKYRTELGRNFQLLMRIEVKTFGAKLSNSQRDTLHLENQLLRNRRQTPTKPLQYQVGTAPLQAFSVCAGRPVWVRHFGIHVLRFSGAGVEDSQSIQWDEKDIDESILLGLLKFDLDPDTLKPMDYRSHHQRKMYQLALLPIAE